jgi:hypothetical protein
MDMPAAAAAAVRSLSKDDLARSPDLRRQAQDSEMLPLLQQWQQLLRCCTRTASKHLLLTQEVGPFVPL